MKVLHVTNQFWPNIGGIEKFTMDLCLKTRPLGVESRVLCLNKGKNDRSSLPKTAEINGIKIRRMPFLNLHYYKPAILPIKELAWADVIHVHGVSALSDYLVLTKGSHKKPIVLNTHGGLFHTQSLSGVKKMYFFGGQKLMLKGVDLVVADSPHDFELFKPIAPRMELIENGVDFSALSKKTKKKQGVFLYVGRLSKNKRLDLLLKTFGELKKQGRDFELRLAGPDWEHLAEELKRLAKELKIEKQVVFLGEVSDQQLAAEYLSAQFFVSASRYEAFGISTIEAMAAGCVPIVSDIPSFRHFINDGKDGYLADFSDPEKTAGLIAKVTGKKSGVSKKARQSALRFSWEKKAKEWLNAYRRLVKEAEKKNGRKV
ncbi:MAG: glycosyltransferase family 4 protein [Candidatus Micrarchaeota archaeon]